MTAQRRSYDPEDAMRMVPHEDPRAGTPPEDVLPEEDFSGGEDFEAELTDPGYLDEAYEVTVEEFSGEDYLLEDDVYGDGAYPADDLMGDGWADPPDSSVPEVDWRSAENADWDA